MSIMYELFNVNYTLRTSIAISMDVNLENSSFKPILLSLFYRELFYLRFVVFDSKML